MNTHLRRGIQPDFMSLSDAQQTQTQTNMRTIGCLMSEIHKMFTEANTETKKCIFLIHVLTYKGPKASTEV